MKFLRDALKKSVVVEPAEIRATLPSFVFVLTLTASSYILRPIRDAMSSNWSDAETSTLFTMTFLVSTVAMFLYGVACARIRIRKLVPGVYLCFALSFLGFYVARQSMARDVFIDKSLFVWVSVYSLFNISVFWTLRPRFSPRTKPSGSSASSLPVPASGPSPARCWPSSWRGGWGSKTCC